MSNLESLKNQLISEIKIELSDNLIDVDVEQHEYQYAIKKTLDYIRARSSNAVEESYVFLDTQEDQTEYILSDEIIEVRKVFRRSIGSGFGEGTGTEIDPFDIAYTNIYLLQAGRQNGLATYDFFAQFQETAGKLFGFYINFKFDHRTHKLTLFRRPKGVETIMLEVYNKVPDELLLTDVYLYPWIRSFAVATVKQIVGNAYRKFATIPGPNGGTTLSGDQLVAEAKEELVNLEEDLKNFVEGGTPYGFIIG